MLRVIVLSILSVFFILGCGSESAETKLPEKELSNSDAVIKDAFLNSISELQVDGKGVVTKLLSDDLEGSKHQRFILRLDSQQTLLIAHNIDLAPKIDSLEVGDLVEFYGEYEWNEQGGLIHFTHLDSSGEHMDGWLRHNDTIYQ
jgi:hypothetical protein